MAARSGAAAPRLRAIAAARAGSEVKTVGRSGQTSLEKSYAGKMLRVERFDDRRIVLTAVEMVPESQLWTLNEPDRSRIERGLAWAAKTSPKEPTSIRF